MSSQLQLRLETSPTRNSRINETLRIDQQDKGPEPPPWPATPAHHTAWSLVRILSIYVSGWKITTPNNSAPLGCSYLTTGGSAIVLASRKFGWIRDPILRRRWHLFTTKNTQWVQTIFRSSFFEFQIQNARQIHILFKISIAQQSLYPHFVKFVN